MYLEYLPDELPPDYPLLIFSPAVPKEVEQLYQALRDIVLQFLGQWWIFTLCPLSLQLMGADYRHKLLMKISV